MVSAGVVSGAGAAAAGAGAAGRGPGRGPPGRGPGVGAALPAAAPSSFAPPNDSRKRRATGGSTVEDADFTNSPCSLSLASSSLLVTPSSLANSCTRALPATALLTDEVEPANARTTSGYLRWTFIAGASRCAHECSYLFFSEFDVTVGASSAISLSRSPVTIPGLRHVVRCRRRGPDQLIQRRCIRVSGYLQCSAECSAPNGLAQTLRGGMQPCTSSVKPAPGVGNHDEHSRSVFACHDPQQLGSQRSLPTTDTGTHRFGARPMGRGQFMLNHRPLYRCFAKNPAFHAYLPVGALPEASSVVGAASLRISIRQPVRRAARRAF